MDKKKRSVSPNLPSRCPCRKRRRKRLLSLPLSLDAAPPPPVVALGRCYSFSHPLFLGRLSLPRPACALFFSPLSVRRSRSVFGRGGDAGTFLKSKIGRKIKKKNNTFNIPAPKTLPGTDNVVPHVIVRDEAFELHQKFMKPYPKQQSLHDSLKAIYDYLLSRSRSEIGIKSKAINWWTVKTFWGDRPF
ncbi:DDE Tnp4 domain-containing protein [Trichonephila clavipes]|nr:DDE Tnp4 domain-containing protein [Trichonephila clavipes]